MSEKESLIVAEPVSVPIHAHADIKSVSFTNSPYHAHLDQGFFLVVEPRFSEFDVAEDTPSSTIQQRRAATEKKQSSHISEL